MSEQEASWHEHMAGMRAGESARTEGADPNAVAAVAAVTAGPVHIADLTLRPANQGTIWTLQRVGREFQNECARRRLSAETQDLLDTGLSLLIFQDARRVWRMLDAGQLATLFDEADALMWERSLETQAALKRHFRREMDRIAALTGDADEDATPGKPMQASGALPATPPPQVQTVSETWSGSPRNME